MQQIPSTQTGSWQKPGFRRTSISLLHQLLAGVAAIALLSLAILACAAPAQAFQTLCTAGSGKAQCLDPQNIAVDTASGRLYVADSKNNRVNVFNATSGAFEEAYGWGVKSGDKEFQACKASCQTGIQGTGPGQFVRPHGIAVDNDPSSPSFHAVYVSDLENRVQKFAIEPSGPKFVFSIGGGVDGTTGGDVCTAASGDTCGVGRSGTGEGEFSSSEISLGVGPTGLLYALDNTSTPQSRLQLFTDTGSPAAPQELLYSGRATGLAVDSSGDFWAIGANGFETPIYKYETGSAIPLVEVIEEGNISAIAVDPSSDHLFAVNLRFPPSHFSIVEYASDGAPLRRFGYGAFERVPEGTGVFHSAAGDIYASEAANPVESPENSRVLHLDFPPPGPLVFPEPCKANPLGNTTATLRAEVNPEGKASGYHFEYVSEEAFQHDVGELGAGHGFDHATRVPASAGDDTVLAADIELHEASAEVALAPSTKYRCRVVATNADGSATGQEGSFESLAPLEVGATWSSGVGLEAATLNATVNPLGIPTTGFFEYVDEETYEQDVAELGADHGFDHALKAPDVEQGEEPIEFGAGEEFKAGSAQVVGLQPGTTYRFRIRATDGYFPQGFAGPTATLRTHQIGEGVLPDARAYELVSPDLKNGAEVGIPGAAGGLSNTGQVVKIQAGAGSGEAVTYTSWTSFGDAESAPIASQYLSKRTPLGWQTENASPFGFGRNALNAPYRGFGPELEGGGFVVDEPPLTPEAQEGFQNLYLRDSQSGAIQALTSEKPDFTPSSEAQGLNEFCSAYAGASADASRAFFAANGAMAGAPAGTGFSLYEWSAAEGLKPLSVLPGETPAPPQLKTSFGAPDGRCSMDQRIVARAVSEDGKLAFWSYGGEYENAKGEEVKKPLFVRIDGKETVELDAREPGSLKAKGPSGEGTFWAATPDGSHAFFSAPGRLTALAGAAGQLYRFDTANKSLTDITPGAVAPELLGVIGAGKDGSELYFVARAALTGEAQGPGGQKAEAGVNNLYLWHEGEGLRFIARLSGADERDWSSAPETLGARVAPGGDLAFMTTETEALSGYDNTVAEGAHCRVPADENRDNRLEGDPRCAEAYLYDAQGKTLTCASCNPTGARPAGPAAWPGWSNPFEGPRYLSEDGSRLFFESFDALSGADQNGRRDVYEFARKGAGGCSEQSPTFNSSSNGCLSLISSGTSNRPSYFIDASSLGRDVFFTTRSRLVGWDSNDNYDVYDAREGGGFAEPPPIPRICEAEACKAPVSPAPSGGPSPGSAAFQGTGNPVQKAKAKKKHKAKKRHHKARRRHHERKAGR